MRASFRVALAVPFIVFLGVYGASVGHGFVADDFGWILDSRVDHVGGLLSLFSRSSGFYRPVVGLTFAADYAIFGAHPLGYGLTNLALALVCGGLLYLVGRELSLPRGAALAAVALWLLNPHGINTAIIWMSGRTSLLLTMGSLAAACDSNCGSTPRSRNFSSNAWLSGSANQATIDSATTLPTPSIAISSSSVASDNASIDWNRSARSIAVWLPT